MSNSAVSYLLYLNSVLQPSGTESRGSRVYCYAPEAKGELEEVLQGQFNSIPAYVYYVNLLASFLRTFNLLT